MENLSFGRDYSYRSPNETYIEKQSEVDHKTAKAGKSILKTQAENLQKPPKNLRFDHIVTHKQTFGRLNREREYQTVVRKTFLPLIDEDEHDDKIPTKQKIIEVENAITSEKKRLTSEDTLNEEDQFYLNQTELILEKLDKLFEGRNNLDPLKRSSPREFQREDEKTAAGSMTGTTGKSKVNKSHNTPSWPKDLKKQEMIEALHDSALQAMQARTTSTAKDLLNQMLALRDYNQIVTFTQDELYSLYLDFDKTKESRLTPEILEQVRCAKTVDEKIKILTLFYQNTPSLFPRTSQEIDEEEVKIFLEEKMDLSFLSVGLTAKFAEVTDNEILNFIIRKYRLS